MSLTSTTTITTTTIVIIIIIVQAKELGSHGPSSYLDVININNNNNNNNNNNSYNNNNNSSKYAYVSKVYYRTSLPGLNVRGAEIARSSEIYKYAMLLLLDL
jgi:hypothetical protein